MSVWLAYFVGVLTVPALLVLAVCFMLACETIDNYRHRNDLDICETCGRRHRPKAKA